ncbi:hypothetical protein SAMN02745885_02726 [Carboxydocella sporoproducens DSM 16521]|uniref:Rubredoxin-like domain-containing protein n=2 Tax=Carboxydocella TaxID=178898 RepID=A0A1T4SKT4_9FIRM|nr:MULTISPECIES: rubredoxin [Carboxydocella]AVX19442.1 hypothetical protein CFE_0233 [Carboxydocella thermautotrophica]AVX29859.1 hypothetical protein CTH_0240 [Carboxydocella thermautotrophica]GAW29076.1 rubredoxin [Carboxydocella sp. ULO1]SKA28481.1 hypothetical protein SAMN02745885_02726 [Carboxydocella sporoproducens DSM 16521]
MMWKCGVCGYIYDGEQAPDNCPKCGAPKEKFSQVPQETVDLILKARRTNDIHMELAGLLDHVLALAEEGIELNLDPPCVGIFTRAKTCAWELRQAIKAEIVGHISKGKWG